MLMLPDGGKPVMQAADHGAPMSETIPKNEIRKEILKLAKSIHDINKADAAEANA